MGGMIPLPKALEDLQAEQINQFIHGESEPEVDLEFKVHSFYFGANEAEDVVIKDVQLRNGEIEDLLNDGWQLDDKIICPPNVMLIFSREKEEVKDGE